MLKLWQDDVYSACNLTIFTCVPFSQTGEHGSAAADFGLNSCEKSSNAIHACGMKKMKRSTTGLKRCWKM